MQNQMCRVCEEPAAGFHFGAFTCEGCKSFFGRTCNNQSVIQECKNNYRCVVDKKNRTACKACRLRKCLMVGMSKSGSRYGRRSNWFKIHCLMQQSMQGGSGGGGNKKPSSSSGMSTEVSPLSVSSLSPTSPPRSWSSSKDTASRELTSPKISSEDHHRSLLTRSPDMVNSPTMVPRTTSIGSTPFPGLVLPQHTPQPPPASPPMMKTPSEAATPPHTAFSSLYGAGGFPSFPLISTPGLHNLPFHKQALLSPLLAHTHLWQMARANANPLLGGGVRPELDLMGGLAEHKALMERFAAAAMAAQTAAAAAVQAASTASKEASKESSPAVSPKTSSTTPEPPQNAPIDLSNKKSDGEDESTDDEMDHAAPVLKTATAAPPTTIPTSTENILASAKRELLASFKHNVEGKFLKSDLNRNVVAQSCEEDEDEEELDVN